jgi:aminoglycoside phosphotransferase (APT) family kinase protein
MAYESWIAEVTGKRVVEILRRPGGGRHQAFDVTLAGPDGREERCFLRADAGEPPAYEHYTLRRESEIYAALAPTPVPVPQVLALHPTAPASLMERSEGSARFAGLEPEAQQAIIDSFVPILASLHDLDVSTLDLPSLLPARSIAEHVLDELDIWESRLDHVAEPQPFLRACFAWLRENLPDVAGPPSLVQGDTGPGNFLHDGRNVTAVLDWELGHLGDPMEDLAWLGTRNAQEPVPDYLRFVRDYEALRGPVDPFRIRYHLVFAELRIAVLSSHHEDSHAALLGEVGNSLIYGALHRRLTCEALADALGVELPALGRHDEEPVTEQTRLYEAGLIQLREIIVPALGDPFASARAKSLARILKYLQGIDRLGARNQAEELEELEDLLGSRPVSLGAGRVALEEKVRAGELSAAELLPLAWHAVRREHQALGSALGVLATRHLPALDGLEAR